VFNLSPAIRSGGHFDGNLQPILSTPPEDAGPPLLFTTAGNQLQTVRCVAATHIGKLPCQNSGDDQDAVWRQAIQYPASFAYNQIHRQICADEVEARLYGSELLHIFVQELNSTPKPVYTRVSSGDLYRIWIAIESHHQLISKPRRSYRQNSGSGPDI
jgi:hypothetical protein